MNDKTIWEKVPLVEVGDRVLGGEDGPVNKSALVLEKRTDELRENQKRTPIQFGTLAEAEVAAAMLPDGQEVEAPSENGIASRYSVISGSLLFIGFVEKRQIEAEYYATLEMFGGGVDKSASANIAAINLLVAEGYKRILLKGIYSINRPIELENVSVVGQNALSSGFWAADDWSGDYMLNHYKYGSVIRGLDFSHFRLEANGRAGCWEAKRLYDGNTINAVTCTGGAPDKNVVRIVGVPTSVDGSNIYMGQTLTAINLFVDRHGAGANASALYIDTLQESVFINTKAWAGTAANAPTHALEIVDSRSITFNTPSFCGNNATKKAVKIKSVNRASHGISFYSPLYENTLGGFIDAEGTTTHKVYRVYQVAPRLESPIGGGYLIDNAESCDIDVGATSAVDLTSTARYNKIKAFVASGVVDSGAGNSVVAMPNAAVAEEVHKQPLEIIRPSTPYLKYSVPGRAHSWRHEFAASSSADNGFRLTRSGVVIQQISANGDSHGFYKSDGVKLFGMVAPSAGNSSAILAIHNGTTVVEKRVLVGAPDSAGAGHRSLYIAN